MAEDSARSALAAHHHHARRRDQADEDEHHGEHHAKIAAKSAAQPKHFNSKTPDEVKVGLRRISSNLIKHQERDHKKRSIFMKVFLHPYFENVSLLVVVTNAVWIGVDIDWHPDQVEDTPLPAIFFEIGESVFCACFLVELFIRVMAYKRTRHFFVDPDLWHWNVLDLVLVLMMVVDTWILTYAIEGGAGLGAFSSFRLLRLLRLTKVLRLVPELGMLVRSMVAAIRSVFSTCALGAGVIYIFSIILTQWVKRYGSKGKCVGPNESVCLQDYFGSISLSWLALFQILVFDDTFELIRPIFKERFTMGCVLICYVLLVSFTILNMLIGIICDIVNEVSVDEKKKILKHHVEDIFLTMDIDDDGEVSREEFEDSGVLQDLGRLGIEPQVAKNAFDICDSDRSGTLQAQEFTRMIFKCLHEPHSEDVMEVECRVDRLADTVGLGRNAIRVGKDKSSKSEANLSVSSGSSTHHSSGSNSGSAYLMAVEAAADKASKLAEAAKEAKRNQIAEEAAYVERLKYLETNLGDIVLLSEASAGSFAKPPADGSEMLMLDNRTFAQRGGPPGAPGDEPSLPTPGFMSILRPALRALDARLHALRATCKASNLQKAGNIPGGGGEDTLPRHGLQPLDDLISEVLSRLGSVRKSLHVPEPKTKMPHNTRTPRKNDVSAEQRAASRERQRSKERNRGTPSEAKKRRLLELRAAQSRGQLPDNQRRPPPLDDMETPLKGRVLQVRNTVGEIEDRETFQVVLIKTSSNSRLGIGIDTADPNHVIIDKVGPGMVEDWNKEHPDQQVGHGDEIIAINGARGDPVEMSEAAQKADTLTVEVARPRRAAIPEDVPEIGMI